MKGSLSLSHVLLTLNIVDSCFCVVQVSALFRQGQWPKEVQVWDRGKGSKLKFPINREGRGSRRGLRPLGVAFKRTRAVAAQNREKGEKSALHGEGISSEILFLSKEDTSWTEVSVRGNMSLGYAEKLSYREDVGTVGMTEIFDSPDVLERKIEELAMMIQKSKHLVAFTGAGISTSCGIPDFRGPKGVWTLQREGKGVPEASLPFHRAVPSLTHMALVELEKAGILKFVISQNVDSLHLRSGIPREKLSELHGNSFREICPSCGAEYLRDFEVETIGMKETSRRCSNDKCEAKLIDTVLDWEDALPPKEMNPAEKHCKMADLVLCLGTSLQITPACNLPLRCTRGGGKLAIVNLQPTPKDKKATLVIHGLVDKVIAGVMRLLNLQIPHYVRIDHMQLSLTQFPKNDRSVKWSLRVASVHGRRAALPFLKSVEVSFPDRPYLKPAVLQEQPFILKRETLKTRPFTMVLVLNFGEGCGCSSSRIEWPVDFQAPRNGFSHDKSLVFNKLRESSVQDSSCGLYAAIERKNVPEPKCEITSYAIVTSIVRYNCLQDAIVHKSNGVVTKRRSESTQRKKAIPKKLKAS